jgi:hypothetical protein
MSFAPGLVAPSSGHSPFARVESSTPAASPFASYTSPNRPSSPYVTEQHSSPTRTRTGPSGATVAGDEEGANGTPKLAGRMQTLEESYAPPEDFLEIEVRDPRTHGERPSLLPPQAPLIASSPRLWTEDVHRLRDHVPHQHPGLQGQVLVRATAIVRVAACVFQDLALMRTRSSDFEAFRDILERESNRVTIPPLPGKVFTNRCESLFRRPRSLAYRTQLQRRGHRIEEGRPRTLPAGRRRPPATAGARPSDPQSTQPSPDIAYRRAARCCAPSCRTRAGSVTLTD